jgi:DNA-directed RNA polymerase subunit beta
LPKKRKLKVGIKWLDVTVTKVLLLVSFVMKNAFPWRWNASYCVEPIGVPSRMNIGQIYETVLVGLDKTWVENLLHQFWWCFFRSNQWIDWRSWNTVLDILIYDGGTGERFIKQQLLELSICWNWDIWLMIRCTFNRAILIDYTTTSWW